jgi:hypothetical protein
MSAIGGPSKWFVPLILLGVLIPVRAIASFNGTAPVPEPASWALLAIGLGGLGVASWMRNRKK